MKLIIFFLMSLSISFAEEISTNSIICEVLGEGSKRIQCTFFSKRVAFDRNITFDWKSPSIEEDHRKRKMILNAHHGSLYDFRYYYGRAPGKWHVSIKDGKKKLAETTFIIEEYEDEEEY